MTKDQHPWEEHGFTNEQWWAMCDRMIGLPVPLAALPQLGGKPFVYDRRWGVFPVPTGWHVSAMRTLLAFHHGETCGIDIAQKLGIGAYDAADYYLKTIPGTAFKSSVGHKVTQTWGPGSLTVIERRLLAPVANIDPLLAEYP